MGIRSTDPARGFLDTFLSSSVPATVGSSPVIVTSGGTQIIDGSNVYHIFSTSGSFVVEEGNIETAEVLIVAGGGGGADGGGGSSAQGGGGGAGGVVYGPEVTLLNGSYPVTVGGPGAAAPGSVVPGSEGDPSSFNSITAIGGGGGIRNNYGYPSPYSTNSSGGSSGGAGGGGILGGPSSTPVTPQPVPVSYIAYGNTGAAHQDVSGGAGGGGGGANASGSPGGSGSAAGGAGKAFPSFPAPVLAPAIPAPVRTDWTTAVGPTGLFGGGGGGGDDNNPSGGGLGGPGGGGRGGDQDSNVTTGVNYTGGGGGSAAAPSTSPWLPTSGGDGIVIIKYTVSL